MNFGLSSKNAGMQIVQMAQTNKLQQEIRWVKPNESIFFGFWLSQVELFGISSILRGSAECEQPSDTMVL